MIKDHINLVIKNYSNLNFLESMVDSIQNNYQKETDVLQLLNFFDALCIIGEFNISIKILDRILEISPDWHDIYDLQARSYWAIHQYDAAKEKWKIYSQEKEKIYEKYDLEKNIYIVGEEWVHAFGNLAMLYPILIQGYNDTNDNFYYKNKYSKEENFNISNYGKHVSNQFLFEIMPNIQHEIPLKIQKIIDQNQLFLKLPFYASKDLKGNFTHWWVSFAERMQAVKEKKQFCNINSLNLDIQLIESKLKKFDFDLNKSFVILHIRESSYWSEKDDLSHSSKNADIKNYISSIKYLTSQGIQVIRIGNKGMKKIEKIKGFFDYANSEVKDELIDLVLISKAEFFICNNSGPFVVAQIFSKPLVGTNWWTMHNPPFFNNDSVLYKKILNVKTNKYLNMDQALNLDFGEYSFYNLLKKNLKLVENDPDQILYSVENMLKNYNNNFLEQKGILNKYKKIAFSKAKIYY